MDEIIRLIRERENFVLAGHTGPDGDSIGSCFALALTLSKMGKNVQVLLEPFTRKFNVIPGKKFLFSGDISTLSPDVFIALDCADPSRLGAAQELFSRVNTTVCIDHHETNPGFAQFNWVQPDASSASEMTFYLIEKLADITPEIAAAVYAGMVSDTGGFRYNATAKSTMETAARLMDMIPFTQIYNELMHQHRFAGGKALGLALEKCKRTPNKKIVYTFMTNAMLKSVDANPTDLDGVVEYLMSTRHAKAAVFVYEKTSGEVKVSLRSQGPNMGRVAAKLGGGGHALAAGATVEGTVEDVLARVLEPVAYEVELFEQNLVQRASISGESTLCGVINVRKEAGYTSHDVVAVLRKLTDLKAGHTGTLDPDATGVLPVCLGRATKLSEYFAVGDKTYIAEIVPGIVTDTGDISGRPCRFLPGDISADSSILSKPDKLFSAIKTVAESFVGDILQVPPMYSAIKIGGKKLYELARKGETVERPPRPVKIHNLRVFEAPCDENSPISLPRRIFMEVTCSKGTYIRSLCMDIGKAAGCGAVMGELTRTRSGNFSIEDSFSLDEIKTAFEAGRPQEVIQPVEKVLPFRAFFVQPEGLKRAFNGNPVPKNLIVTNPTGCSQEPVEIETDEKVWLYSTENRLIGLFSAKNGSLQAEVML